MAVKASASVTLSWSAGILATIRYYQLASPTSATPAVPSSSSSLGSWTETEPTADVTKVMWVCERTVYADGTESWSKASKSTSYEAAKDAKSTADAAKDAIDNLEIGGRNLYIRSTTVPGYLSAGATDNINSPSSVTKERTSDYISIDANSAYVLQSWFDDSDTSQYSWMCLHWYTDNKEPISEAAREHMQGLVYRKRLLTSPANAAYARISARFQEIDEWRQKIKFEKGNKSTDWTPAPEDTDSAVKDAKKAGTDAQTSANSAQKAANDVDKRLKSVESDYVTSATLNTTKESIEADISSTLTESKKYTDDSITTEVTNRNAAITAKADEINSSVEKTYITKDDAQDIYSTKTELDQTAETISSSVSKKVSIGENGTVSDLGSVMEQSADGVLVKFSKTVGEQTFQPAIELTTDSDYDNASTVNAAIKMWESLSIRNSGGTPVTEINGPTMKINKVVVVDSIRIGTWFLASRSETTTSGSSEIIEIRSI